MAYVYVHMRPDSCAPFYVGKGNGGRIGRRKRNKHFNSIVNKFGWEKIIVISVCDHLSDDEAYIIEEVFIREIGLERDGGTLVNLGYGGEGGPIGVRRSDEWRKIRSMRAREVCARPEWKAQARLRMLGNTRSKGHERTPEANSKRSEKLRGNKHTLGYKHKEEAKAKMRAAIAKRKDDGRPVGQPRKRPFREIFCETCGARIVTVLKEQRFCSKLCAARHLAIARRKPDRLIQKECAWCGKLIITEPKKMCCSVACSNHFRVKPKSSSASKVTPISIDLFPEYRQDPNVS